MNNGEGWKRYFKAEFKREPSALWETSGRTQAEIAADGERWQNLIVGLPSRILPCSNCNQSCVGNSSTLRPLQLLDWDAVFAAASDPLIWEMHPVRNRWRPDVFRVFFDSAIASGGAFVILESSSGQVIGSTRFLEYDASTSEIEIGYTFLTRAYWGGGANSEVKRLMLNTHFAS